LVLNSGKEAYRDSKRALRAYNALRSERSMKEVGVFQGLRVVLSSGAGVGRILQHLESGDTDVAFISAFLTGDDPDAGGYGVYAEGESDSRGNVHKAGERVSRNENKLRNKSLGVALSKAGYGFIRVEGNYGAPEDSYCVINVVEDFKQFESVMHRLGNEFGQDSVLICPRDGSPYFYKFDGTKEFTVASGKPKLLGAVEEYFTGLKGKKFAFTMNSGFSFSEATDIPWARSSLSPVRHGYACVGVDAYRKKLLAGMNKPWGFNPVSNEGFIAPMGQGQVQEELAQRIGLGTEREGGMIDGNRGGSSQVVRPFVRSRRGIKSKLGFVGFDQWKGAMFVYSSLGDRSLRSWLALLGYDDSAQDVVSRLVRERFAKTPELLASAMGPRTLAAWRLYEISQKLKEGGLSYKETVAMMAKEADISPKEVKDIIGTSEEWREGVFDFGLEPLHPDEAEAIRSQRDRGFAGETERIYSAVVARQDPVKNQFLSGQINLVEAIDEMVAAGLDYEEAEEIANSWLPGND
jgi:hypothetical protein